MSARYGHRDTNPCFLVEILKGAWAQRRNWEYGAANCVSPHVALAESRCHSLPHQLPVLIRGPCQQAGASQELRKSQMMSHTATAQHACAKPRVSYLWQGGTLKPAVARSTSSFCLTARFPAAAALVCPTASHRGCLPS